MAADLPPRNSGFRVIDSADVRAFFENMDAAADRDFREGSVYDDQRSVIEQRLRDAVGLTMPSCRFHQHA